MKTAVAAANGKAGRLIVKEAIERGHDVTAFARRENKTDAKKFMARDIMDLTADDPKTGKYLVGGEKLIVNEKGESIIGYADYAAAMVDEIEKGTHIKQRIGVCRA